MPQLPNKDKLRFIEKLEKGSPEECWEWKYSRIKTGYGNFHFGRTKLKAHRVSYLIFVGKIPDGICVLHRCDNPPCCNPAHLFLGTHLENIRDAVAKGRMDHKLMARTMTPKKLNAVRRNIKLALEHRMKHKLFKNHKAKK